MEISLEREEALVLVSLSSSRCVLYLEPALTRAAIDIYIVVSSSLIYLFYGPAHRLHLGTGREEAPLRGIKKVGFS